MNDKPLLVIHLFGRKCKVSRIGKFAFDISGSQMWGLMADAGEHDVGQFCEDLPSHFNFVSNGQFQCLPVKTCSCFCMHVKHRLINVCWSENVLHRICRGE
jgi:hypothetical protein